MGAVVDSLHAGSLACVSSGDLVSGDAISRLALTSLALLLGQVLMPWWEASWSCSFDLYLCRWAGCLIEPSSSTYICVVEWGSVVAGGGGGSLLSQPRFQSMRAWTQYEV